MKLKIVRVFGDIEEIEADPVRIRVGKKTITVAAHPSIVADGVWVVTSPDTGARIAWGDTKREAVAAARKKIQAIGYARYWQAVRLHQRKVLGGKTPDKAKRASIDGYKGLSKTKLAKENRSRLEAAGALQS